MLYTLKRTYGTRAVVSWPIDKQVERSTGDVITRDNSINLPRLIMLPLRYTWEMVRFDHSITKASGTHQQGDREFIVDKCDLATWGMSYTVAVAPTAATYQTVSYEEYEQLFYVVGRKI